MAIKLDNKPSIEISEPYAKQVEDNILNTNMPPAPPSRPNINLPQRPTTPPNGSGEEFYLPPYSFNYNRREDGTCGCDPGFNLITNVVNGVTYWACIGECLGDSTLSSVWNDDGTSLPYCVCPPGFYFSQNPDTLGCVQIPICRGIDPETGASYIYDYNLEKCVINCPEGMYFVEDPNVEQFETSTSEAAREFFQNFGHFDESTVYAGRCECEPDPDGRRRIYQNGSCEVPKCNSTNFPEACAKNNELFQARLIATIFKPDGWMSNIDFQACYEKMHYEKKDDIEKFVQNASFDAIEAGKFLEPNVALLDSTVANLLSCYGEACNTPASPIQWRFGRYRNGEFEEGGSAAACLCYIQDICKANETTYDPGFLPDDFLEQATKFFDQSEQSAAKGAGYNISLPWSEVINSSSLFELSDATINVTDEGDVVIVYTGEDGTPITQPVTVMETTTAMRFPPLNSI